MTMTDRVRVCRRPFADNTSSSSSISIVSTIWIIFKLCISIIISLFIYSFYSSGFVVTSIRFDWYHPAYCTSIASSSSSSSYTFDRIAPLLSDSIFRTNAIHFFVVVVSNLIFWLPIYKPSLLRDHPASFAGYLLLKTSAMVISWSRRSFISIFVADVIDRSFLETPRVSVSAASVSRSFLFFCFYRKSCISDQKC